MDAQTGEMLWKTKVDEHAAARVTGAPAFANGRLYVPVSSIEEVPGARPNYPCCTFRGSVVALDAATGKQIWKTYMIPEEPKIVGKNSAGTPLWKSAGAAIWTSPTIDAAKNTIYVATGNAYTESGRADQRRGRRARHDERRHPVGAAGDAQRCVRDRLQAGRRELSG